METVIDGEVVALDETGRPSFNALQNYGSSNLLIIYLVFDVVQSLTFKRLTRAQKALRVLRVGCIVNS